MAGKVFERNYFIHIYETNLRKELTVASMMSYFEEMALLQSEKEAVGFDFFTNNQVAWVLHQFDINMIRFPEFGETVRLFTKPAATYRFMGYREFLILDAEGIEIVRAYTSWLFINHITRRPQKVHEQILQAYGLADVVEDKVQMPEVPEITKVDNKKEFQVRYSDIDVNQHVNNTHYVEWALEAVPDEIRDQCRMTNLRIVFKKETPFKAKICSEVQVEQNETGFECIHRISTDEGVARSQLFTKWAII
jgi:medium-chain acyl-[acyl-carrier-protein] hydrolase